MTNQRYVLLRTADISDVPGREPYVWVEEEHVPITFICRRPNAIAPLSVLIKYLPAPRGGMISSWQSGSETLCRLRIGPD